MEKGHRARTVASRKNLIRSPNCKFNHLARESMKLPCMNPQLKPPKCFIKITGSRYNGTFLLNIDDGLDDAIYRTMRDIEVALDEQTDPMGKPRVSPKNCLSSVFRCFGTSELETKAVCSKKKSPKAVNKPAECSLTATINKSDLGSLIDAVQSSQLNPFPSPLSQEKSDQRVMRDVVDVFRTTLDQFRNTNLDSLEAPQPKRTAEVSVSKQPSPISARKTENASHTRSGEELKKVAVIKFSQEEVLVIQPPKPSDNDKKELEVGIEVKPKTTAANVGQSIKLAKDKVLIGVQDGRGVLQINDGVPKRSLHMVIEEGVNGKPSMKLSLKEEKSEENEPSCNQGHDTRKGEGERQYPKTYINSWQKGNESISNMANNTENTLDSPDRRNVKHHKSVESQVSGTRINSVCTNETKKYKSESTQYQFSPTSDQSRNESHCGCCTVKTKLHTAENVANDCSDVSQDTVVNPPPSFKNYHDSTKPRDSRFNRVPFLVHTLYEPRSRQNSSAYFASKSPSKHSSRSKPLSSKKSKRQVKKPKSFSFSSDYSGSSKCTKIFRDIVDIGVEEMRKEIRPPSKKDTSMTCSFVDDLDAILQNMCGSSYLCHHSEPQNGKPEKLIKHSENLVNVRKQVYESMSFDQWTQTDILDRGCKAVSEPSSESTISEGKPVKLRDSCDGTHLRTLKKKGRKTKSCSSQRVDESSVTTSGLEDGLSSDSSDSNKHKLVFSMVSAPDDTSPNPLVRTRSALAIENLIPRGAKSFIGQTIFAAIEDCNSPPEPLNNVRNTDSFLYPTCKDASPTLFQGHNNVSVVNMALYEPSRSSLPDIMEEELSEVSLANEPAALATCNVMDEDWKMEVTKLEVSGVGNCGSSLEHAHTHGPSFPIRVKSKSCQDLSSTHSEQSIHIVDSGFVSQKSQIKKVRYPHLTATDSGTHMPAMNVCGILNLNEGGILQSEDRLTNIKNRDHPLDDILPSAIRSLLLPRQNPLEFDNHEHSASYSCDRLEPTNFTNWNLGLVETGENYWCTSNDAFEETKQVSVHRSLFKRTFFAMKSVGTVVTRKFSTLFRKLSTTHSDRKKVSPMQESSTYVAVPLKKKKENLLLYPRAQ